MTDDYMREVEAAVTNNSLAAADNYEHDLVKKVLRHFSLDTAVGKFVRDRKYQSNIGTLDFLWFSGMFPGCPVHFGSIRLSHALSRVKWPGDWFKRFEKLAMVPAFDALVNMYDEQDLPGPVCLLFSVPQTTTIMGLHNWRHRRTATGGFWAFLRDNGDTVWMEPLELILRDISSHWTPELN